MKRSLMLAGIFSAAMFGSASSAEISNTEVGAWKVGAYSLDNNGQFSHCAASTSYVDGTLLAFAIDAQGASWRVGLSNQAWNLPPGAGYPVSYRVDNDVPSYNTAHVVNPQLAMFDLPPFAAVFERFRKGQTLTVSAVGHQFLFRLTGSSKALSMALACAVAYRQPAAPSISANPFEPAPTAVPATADTNVVEQSPALVSEGVSILHAVLDSAGLPGLQVGAPTGGLTTSFHAVFAAEGVVGGISIFPSRNANDIAEFGLSTMSQGCVGGDFASARKINANGVLNVSTMCKKLTDTKSADFFVASRPAGGSVLILLTPVGAPSPSQNHFGDVIGAGIHLQ